MGSHSDLSKLKRKYEKQKEIINNTPAGIHVCYLDEPIHLEYVSEGLCNMLGYSKEEFNTYTRDYYAKNIVEEDVPIFVEFVEKLASKPCKATCIYKMIKKDGSIIYVSDTMESVICSDGIMRGYSSVTNITELITVEKKLKDKSEKYRELYKKSLQSDSRFRMISKFSGILFLEYDIENNMCTSIVNNESVLFYSRKELKNIMEERKNYKIYEKIIESYGGICYLLHEDDIKIVELSIDELMRNKKSTINVRLLCGDGKYHWFLVESYISTDNRNIMMGCLRNIDDEKEEIDNLRNKVKLDPMTGVLNKVEGLKEICEYIENNPDTNNVFLFIDIDNFKAINDNLGHKTGDVVIKYLIKCILSSFRDDDIIARFGGDEFFIFMKNISKSREDMILERIKRINMLCNKCHYLKGTSFRLSISAGIAFSEDVPYSKDAKLILRKMFIIADDSLYKMKMMK